MKFERILAAGLAALAVLVAGISIQRFQTGTTSTSSPVSDSHSLGAAAVPTGVPAIVELAWSQPFPPARNEVVADTMGNRLERPVDVPVISKVQAYAKAVTIPTSVTPDELARATRVVARYGLFTSDSMRDCKQQFADAGALDSNGHLGKQVPDIDTDKCKRLFDGIPAWIITFEGLEIPSNGPPGSEPEYNHEMNVVIDARTGEYVHWFTYR
jgi:hypothetical protein